MARVEVIKGFLNAEECAVLNAWSEQGVKNKWLDLGRDRENHKYTSRLTTRMYGDRFETPEIVFSIIERIRDLLGLPDAPVIEGHGRDGFVVSYTYPGGDIYPHIDPPPQTLSALRCNIVSQAPDDGGELWVADQRVVVGAGDLHCYLVTENTHYVTEVKGQTPRILWMFGFCVSPVDWESGKIQVGEFA